MTAAWRGLVPTAIHACNYDTASNRQPSSRAGFGAAIQGSQGLRLRLAGSLPRRKLPPQSQARGKPAKALGGLDKFGEPGLTWRRRGRMRGGMSANRPWLLALLALTALRLVAAAALPLSGDEAYYWVWSHALAPGYLDHPPMVALWIRAGTLLAGQGGLGVRLLGPLSAAGGTLLLAQAAGALLPGSGVPAAALFNGTLLLGAGAVTMTPDTPLVFFWTVAMWTLARLLATGQGAWWLAVGAASGLALDSKYTGGFLGAGIVLWLAWVPGLRHWFRSGWLWAGGAAAAWARPWRAGPRSRPG